jgi:hypothetical protein
MGLLEFGAGREIQFGALLAIPESCGEGAWLATHNQGRHRESGRTKCPGKRVVA